jgi:hypothetical protein
VGAGEVVDVVVNHHHPIQPMLATRYAPFKLGSPPAEIGLEARLTDEEWATFEAALERAMRPGRESNNALASALKTVADELQRGNQEASEVLDRALVSIEATRKQLDARAGRRVMKCEEL